MSWLLFFQIGGLIAFAGLVLIVVGGAICKAWWDTAKVAVPPVKMRRPDLFGEEGDDVGKG